MKLVQKMPFFLSPNTSWAMPNMLSYFYCQKQDFITEFSVTSANFSIFDYKNSIFTSNSTAWHVIFENQEANISPDCLYISVTSFRRDRKFFSVYFGVLSC